MFNNLCNGNGNINDICQLSIIVTLLWLIAILMVIRHFKKVKTSKGEHRASAWQVHKSSSFSRREEPEFYKMPMFSTQRSSMLTPSVYPPVIPYDLNVDDDIEETVSRAVELIETTTSYESDTGSSSNDSHDD